jgi:hypothetical protein
MAHIPDIYYLISIGTLLIASGTGWASGRLFKTKTIKDIVETANSTINLYEARETALEEKVDGLTAEVAQLSVNLVAAQAESKALRELLIKIVGPNVALSLGVEVHGPDAPPAA